MRCPVPGMKKPWRCGLMSTAAATSSVSPSEVRNDTPLLPEPQMTALCPRDFSSAKRARQKSSCPANSAGNFADPGGQFGQIGGGRQADGPVGARVRRDGQVLAAVLEADGRRREAGRTEQVLQRVRAEVRTVLVVHVLEGAVAQDALGLGDHEEDLGLTGTLGRPHHAHELERRAGCARASSCSRRSRPPCPRTSRCRSRPRSARSRRPQGEPVGAVAGVEADAAVAARSRRAAAGTRPCRSRSPGCRGPSARTVSARGRPGRGGNAGRSARSPASPRSGRSIR